MTFEQKPLKNECYLTNIIRMEIRKNSRDRDNEYILSVDLGGPYPGIREWAMGMGSELNVRCVAFTLFYSYI